MTNGPGSTKKGPDMTIANFAHNLLHRHTLAEKAGVGTFTTCAWRLGSRCDLAFRPDLSGARWHLVPGGTALLEAMLNAGSPHEAMALLRQAGREDPR